jgi:hypothetical protein
MAEAVGTAEATFELAHPHSAEVWSVVLADLGVQPDRGHPPRKVPSRGATNQPHRKHQRMAAPQLMKHDMSKAIGVAGYAGFRSGDEVSPIEMLARYSTRGYLKHRSAGLNSKPCGWQPETTAMSEGA